MKLIISFNILQLEFYAQITHCSLSSFLQYRDREVAWKSSISYKWSHWRFLAFRLYLWPCVAAIYPSFQDSKPETLQSVQAQDNPNSERSLYLQIWVRQLWQTNERFQGAEMKVHWIFVSEGWVFSLELGQEADHPQHLDRDQRK